MTNKATNLALTAIDKARQMEDLMPERAKRKRKKGRAMNQDASADFGALPIDGIQSKPTRGGYREEDSVPVGVQRQTGNRIEMRLIDQKSGHARHAVNTNTTLILTLYHHGMLGNKQEIGATRLHAAEQLQEDFEATGNRQKMCGDYSPVRSEGEATATDEEMAASVRYHNAIDALLPWQWRCVRQVCIDGLMVDGLDLQHLSDGLDKLIKHYGK